MADSLSEIKIKIEKLRDEIRHHERLYYVESKPEISDREFDDLMLKLQNLEREYPEFITSDSPTQRVGGAITSFNTINHRVAMMSIENSYSLGDIALWADRAQRIAGQSAFPVVAELKIDGVSGSFNYNNGLFQFAATRGNGDVGDVITENVKTIKSLPLKIKAQYDMDIRGEIYIARSQLAKLNQIRTKEGKEPFKNCRNLTSGTIKSFDPAVVAQRSLKVMVYGIAQGLSLGFERHSDIMAFLTEQGFKVNHRYRVCNSLKEVEDFIQKVKAEKNSFDFDIDGVVLKVDSLAAQERLGATSKAPRWAIAYKYEQERAESTLLRVEWQTGRSHLTPVAHFTPVELGGTTVSRASLHNIDCIREKDIRLFDKIIIEKAGYIIPYVVKSLPEKRTGEEQQIELPTVCPVCASPLEIKQDETCSTQVCCRNKQCQGVLARRIIHFISQLEIEGIGSQLVEQIIDNSLADGVEDILDLTKEQLEILDKMGKKSAEKVTSSIAAASKKPLARLISALGIPNTGIVISEKIADEFNQSFDAFLSADINALVAIDGISDNIASSILSFIASEHNKSLIERLKLWWKGPGSEELAKMKTQGVLSGKVFVITGQASVPRKKIEELIKGSGGVIKSSVSSKTDYLLIGSKEDESYVSAKKSKALQLNVKIINELELEKML